VASLAGDGITARGTAHRNAGFKVLISGEQRSAVERKGLKTGEVKGLGEAHSAPAKSAAYATDKIASHVTALDIEDFEARLNTVCDSFHLLFVLPCYSTWNTNPRAGAR
jgi:hypothetical protein